ncbi:hypothetical protein [uncultured Aureimonas sp.]|uniref:hypothetical protein n=1 Tax=uncultured Aureimonas sp. TaxID=1604662 RepID=UPI002600E977|nr:hypothetical protein [uncultured Aureimonas sp.]
MSETERVAMTDLAERLLGPGGAGEAKRLSARLDALADDNRRRLDAGEIPAVFERRQTLARALEAARDLMRGICRWAPPGSPNT